MFNFTPQVVNNKSKFREEEEIRKLDIDYLF